MKIAKQRLFQRLFPSNRKGVALITVLTVMSLTTILVLTFFSLATNEHRASKTYSQGLQAQQVAEQAVNMVIAQIREATTVSDNPSNIKAWASQPGAIRTWNQSGGFDRIFKLYSDDIMKSDDEKEVQADFTDLQDWDSQPDHYVDLNEPVIRGERVYYPIVNPTASVIPEKWIGGYKDSEDTFNDNGVEGFRYNYADGESVKGGALGDKAAVIAKATDGHVPMPVRWIYQLADGTLGSLAKGSSGSKEYQFVAFSGNGKASEKNPLVARFAFWADDETTKLNVNTHVGGATWDLPRAGGKMDREMAKHQPAKNEWQRYPGHPATTHLSPAMAPGYVLNLASLQAMGQSRAAMEKLFKVVPRVVGGGSESGTRVINRNDPLEKDGLIPDTNPLYPSIDDLVMDADREPHVYPDSEGGEITGTELGDYLERSKFFLTAYSRAPEVNMFNLPRVAIWPIFNTERSEAGDSDYQRKLSPFDRLIHYCATVGPVSGTNDFDYIFKREKADSATYDYDSISRNQDVYKYLDRLMKDDYPGFGDSFESKYGADQEQILTEIFDYIRTTNIYDDSLYVLDTGARNRDGGYSPTNTDDHLGYTNWRNATRGKRGEGLKGHGQVVPIEISDTKGFGRMYSLASTQIMAICAGQPGMWNTGRFPGAVTPPDEDVFQTDILYEPYGKVFLNLPPLPKGIDKEKPDATWPTWLTTLRTATDDVSKAEYEAAFKPYNWNWQLAFADSGYRRAVLSDPTANRFNRDLITATSSQGMRLQPTERMVQGAMLFNLFTPSVGWVAINPDMEIEITATSGGMTFAGVDGSVPFLGFGHDADGFASGGGDTYVWATNWVESIQGARRYGGILPFQYTMHALPDVVRQAGRDDKGRNASVHGGKGRLTPIDRFYNKLETGVRAIDGTGRGKRDIINSSSDVADAYRYDLVTIPFKISTPTLDFTGGDVEFKFFPGRDRSEGTLNDESSSSDPLQEITIEFPDFDEDAPSAVEPIADAGGDGWRNRRRFGPMLGKLRRGGGNPIRDSFTFLERVSLTADPGNDKVGTNLHKASLYDGATETVTKSEAGLAHGRMGQLGVHRSGGLSSMIGPGDIVRSVEVTHGDLRLVAAQKVIGAGEHFEPHRYYDNGDPDTDGDDKMAHSMTNSVGNGYWGFRKESDYLIVPDLPKVRNRAAYHNRTPVPFGTEKSKDVQFYGDFDNGVGLMIDGPYINKPDEGNISNLDNKTENELDNYWADLGRERDLPYFASSWRGEAGGAAFFSPNRMVSGPGTFGSLPTGIKSQDPWQTLLFRPDVEGNDYKTHPGAESPPDHLIMDLFWMPVVEPYAISEPLSTAGKVNMNYQMAPFLHVDRSTALRGVFRSEYMSCVPSTWHTDYKARWGVGFGKVLERVMLRSAIMDSATLEQFSDYFGDGEKIFKSATEICDIHLIPEQLSDWLELPKVVSAGSYTPTVDQMKDGEYWRRHAIVGDNSREKTYTNIYQRLTTKSNTFKVHFRAQVIKQSRRESDSEYGVWRPELDTVQAEYRGSSIVERFVDPNNPNLPDFATDETASLDEYYQYRVVNPRRFAP